MMVFIIRVPSAVMQDSEEEWLGPDIVFNEAEVLGPYQSRSKAIKSIDWDDGTWSWRLSDRTRVNRTVWAQYGRPPYGDE